MSQQKQDNGVIKSRFLTNDVMVRPNKRNECDHIPFFMRWRDETSEMNV